MGKLRILERTGVGRIASHMMGGYASYANLVENCVQNFWHLPYEPTISHLQWIFFIHNYLIMWWFPWYDESRRCS